MPGMFPVNELSTRTIGGRHQDAVRAPELVPMQSKAAGANAASAAWYSTLSESKSSSRRLG